MVLMFPTSTSLPFFFNYDVVGEDHCVLKSVKLPDARVDARGLLAYQRQEAYQGLKCDPGNVIYLSRKELYQPASS